MTPAGALAPDPVAYEPARIKIDLTDHAVDRFWERVRPALTRPQAAEELRRLLAMGPVTNTPPPWLAARQRQRTPFYLLLGDVVLPLEPSRRNPEALVALTCLTRGGLSMKARQARTNRRAHRRLYNR